LRDLFGKCVYIVVYLSDKKEQQLIQLLFPSGVF